MRSVICAIRIAVSSYGHPPVALGVHSLPHVYAC
jgi:hypothetical protein